MNIPIQGIQIVLVAAFFVSMGVAAIEIFNVYKTAALIGGGTEFIVDAWLGIAKDVAYNCTYLAYVAIIEILNRLWLKQSQ